jgi:predicted nucleic acid-binding protein
MKLPLDTNILLRLSELSHPHHPIAVQSLRRLAAAGHTFCIASQTVSEFLAVATRSAADRGLGMDPTSAEAELDKLISSLDTLYDSPATLLESRKLLVAHQVIGKSVHDAKLVAAMKANGINDILTFNGRDFIWYSGINVIEPSGVPN